MTRKILPVTIAILTATLLLNAPCFRAAAVERTSESVVQLEVDQLIFDLSDSKFAIRESATARLIEIGQPAVLPLLKVCNSSDMEVSWRAVRALETIGLEGDLKTLKMVMAGLLSVADDSNQSLINRSRKLATSYQEYQTQVAVKKLRAMGATVHESSNHSGMFDMGMGFAVPIEAEFARPRIIIAEAEMGFDLSDLVVEVKEPEEAKPEEAQEQEDAPDSPDDVLETEVQADSCGSFEELEDEETGDESDEEDQPVDEVDESKEADAAEPKTAADETPSGEVTLEPEDKLAAEIDKLILEAMEDARPVVPADIRGERVFGGGGRIVVMGDGRVVSIDGSEPESAVSRSIVIDQNWTGGAEGLKLIAEVNNLNSIQVSGIEIDAKAFENLGLAKQLRQVSFHNCTFDANDMMKFVARHPQSHISAVGIAMMGVYPTQYTSPEKKGCEIARVAEKSGAEKAGLKAGDTIVKVDDVKVVDFPTLTYTVAGREVGDVLDVVVLRDGEEVETKLTLSSRDGIE